MTLMDEVRREHLQEDVLRVAADEGRDLDFVRRGVASGRIVVLHNPRRRGGRPVGVGEGLRTKINANIGTSPSFCDPEYELRKVEVAVKYGADAVMDLSTAGAIDSLRRRILEVIEIPVGTVPIYQALVEGGLGMGEGSPVDVDRVFSIIERHAAEGVDFMTIHSGITKVAVEKMKEAPRVTGIVSRGGAFIASWIRHTGQENPLYSNFDYVLELAKKYDFCISLGDALRSGSLADASDVYQIQELLTLSRLVERCREAGVQAMVEGPGHLPLDQIQSHVILEKALCKGAPFYVLGPIVTDIAPGYDHVVSAIGGAVASLAGADFLCYVTPSEHLGLPTLDDVREGVMASRIAAHCSDIVKLGDKIRSRDLEMASARAGLDWERQYQLSLDPEKARRVREASLGEGETCSMCGSYCVFKLLPKRGDEAVKNMKKVKV